MWEFQPPNEAKLSEGIHHLPCQVAHCCQRHLHRILGAGRVGESKGGLVRDGSVPLLPQRVVLHRLDMVDPITSGRFVLRNIAARKLEACLESSLLHSCKRGGFNLGIKIAAMGCDGLGDLE